MFQTVGHHAIDLYAEAMDLPLFRQDITGTSVVKDKDYQPTRGDEVEDLYELLKRIQVSHLCFVHPVLTFYQLSVVIWTQSFLCLPALNGKDSYVYICNV